FFECAQALGRHLREHPGGPTERIRYAFRLCLARDPSPAETARLGRLFEELLHTCRSHPEAAAKLAGAAQPARLDLAEAAAWVALARTVLNLDEFVTRE